MQTVIADDITGAAEIAGIAFSKGMRVKLQIIGPKRPPLKPTPIPSRREGGLATTSAETNQTPLPSGGDGGGLQVIATDTRSMSAQEAYDETLRICRHLSPLSGGLGGLLYKKTDSALRGNVVSELRALMEATGARRAVWVPANPSRGRVIRAGVYYIGEKPISETDFSFDPEFPARTSSVRERFPDAAANGILIPDAETTDDLRRILRQYDDGHTLFAGAADFYAVRHALQPTPIPSRREEPTPIPSRREGRLVCSCACSSQTPLPSGGDGGGFQVGGGFLGLLLLCGSTQSRPPAIGIPISEMPRAVYDGDAPASDWLEAIRSQQAGHHSDSLILTIPHRHRTGKAAAVHLRSVMAEVVGGLIGRQCPDQLIIEGGATAYAVLTALGWTDFELTRQIAPGVVQMRAACGTLVTLKPGSYAWGGLFNTD